jgi:hypothetical protein
MLNNQGENDHDTELPDTMPLPKCLIPNLPALTASA